MQCQQCQYDLSGHVPNQHALVTCPECGLEQPLRLSPPPFWRGALPTFAAMVAPPTVLLVLGMLLAAVSRGGSGELPAAILVVFALLVGAVGPIAIAATVESQVLPGQPGRNARIFFTLVGGWITNTVTLTGLYVLLALILSNF